MIRRDDARRTLMRGITGTPQLADLPITATTILREFTGAVQAACGKELRSVILFGSAAEGRLRLTSDLNVLVIADQYRVEQLDALRLTLRAGRAASGLTLLRQLPKLLAGRRTRST